jgi:hypothetical protein
MRKYTYGKEVNDESCYLGHSSRKSYDQIMRHPTAPETPLHPKDG